VMSGMCHEYPDHSMRYLRWVRSAKIFPLGSFTPSHRWVRLAKTCRWVRLAKIGVTVFQHDCRRDPGTLGERLGCTGELQRFRSGQAHPGS
jgi:hypothetical protein